jgi:pilus assembly protein Flp/PilA
VSVFTTFFSFFREYAPRQRGADIGLNEGFHLTFSSFLPTTFAASRSLMGATSMNTVSRFLRDNSGATAIEYGLIAAGISIAIIVAVNQLGSTLNTNFANINTQLK